MSERSHGAKGEDAAAGAKTKATSGKQGHRVSRPGVYCPEPPKIDASAQAMAVYLERYAEELLRIARQLRDKAKDETVALPWPPCPIVVYCNGGGNGGGGGE